VLSIYGVADPAMLPKQIDFQGGTFVDSVKAMDLDFDGLPDILGIREFGGKWAKHCVWLFDPKRGRFIQDALSHQMEDLENLGVDAESRLVFASTIGPTLPTRDEYRIDNRSEVRGERRLLPVRSCQLDTGAPEGSTRTAKVVRYENGQAAVERGPYPRIATTRAETGARVWQGKKPRPRNYSVFRKAISACRSSGEMFNPNS
jgi:hypothetical protein